MVETGLSDFKRITVTVIETNYENSKPKITYYGDYKNFCEDKFWQILLEKCFNTNCSELEKFLQIYLNAFNLFAPCKEKYSRENNMSLTAKNS